MRAEAQRERAGAMPRTPVPRALQLQPIIQTSSSMWMCMRGKLCMPCTLPVPHSPQLP